MQRGAIILCGGNSARMGRDKALLPFGPGEVLLQRVARLVNSVVPAERIICVAAPNQTLPALPAQIEVVVDRAPHRGPLAGLAGGLAALEPQADAAFVIGCDAPRLVPAVIEQMFDLLGDHDIAAPHDGRHWRPLPAVVRTALRPRVEALLDAGERSLAALVASCGSRRVAPAELEGVDPALASFAPCNTPDEYRAALSAAGFSDI